MFGKWILPVVAVVSMVAFMGCEPPNAGTKDSAAGQSSGGVKVGQPAPAFTLEDQNGKKVSLSDYAGKVVVLEWFNKDCPFVAKHYKTGHMNGLATKYAANGVVWLAINSSDAITNDLNKAAAAEWKIDRPILNDANGTAGNAYGAVTTPAMYIINTDGKVVYEGAIDNRADTETESLSVAKNYVVQALDEVLAGKPVSEPFTKSYGCGIKY
jgi:peroxiredoxin